MLSIPNLPTDSFYKFLFVLGKILLMVSGWLTSTNLKVINNEGYQSDSLSNDWNDRLDSLNQVYRLKVLRSNHLLAELKSKENSVQGFKSVNDETMAQLDSAFMISVNSSKALEEAYKRNFKEKRIRALKTGRQGNILTLYFIVIISLYGLGLYLTIYGGLSWRKLQKIQDQILLCELRRIENESNKPSIFYRKHNDGQFYVKRKSLL